MKSQSNQKVPQSTNDGEEFPRHTKVGPKIDGDSFKWYHKLPNIYCMYIECKKYRNLEKWA